MNALLVRHVPQSEPPAFQVMRLPDAKPAGEPVAVPSPAGFAVEGRPNDLLVETKWYLERFLDYPFEPETDHAQRVQDALRAWGQQAFTALFDNRKAGQMFDAIQAAGGHLQIASDDPRVLAWPWEALHDTKGYLAHSWQIERRLDKIEDPPDLPANLPRDQVNILLVTARPFEDDVHYRSISRPLVELVARHHLPAQVTVLRPPTFARLREHLHERPAHYHILHFDGHGSYGGSSGSAGPFTYQGPMGKLVFEKKDGQPDLVDARQLAELLQEHALPAVVLNACQSAMVDGRAEDAFASVAAALLQSGMRSVVAMAYSLYVSGAQRFLPAFYRRLFEAGSVTEAVRAGRQAMLEDRGRVCVRGTFPLDDWLVPVLYQQSPVDFSFAKQAAPAASARPSKLPPEVTELRDPYGFVGRDGPLLELERALRRPPPAILIQGLGGVGKTTLARGFLQWLDATNGLGEGSLWFDFREIRSAEFVLNRLGERLFGAVFATKKAEQKIDDLGKVFHEHRFIIVWDNFEVAHGIPGTQVTANLSESDRNLVVRLLDRLRDGASKVIITSRSPEEWLGGPERRYLLPLGGLESEERWEYCTVILLDVGRTINREDKDLAKLIDLLGGHPLAMRAVLPHLEKMSAAAATEAVRNNLASLGAANDSQAKLNASLAFVEQSLPEGLRPLLIPLAMHEDFVDADGLEAIAKAMDAAWSRRNINRLLETLVFTGVVRLRGPAIFELHPALTGFLRSFLSKKVAPDVRDNWARIFVDLMHSVANDLATKEHSRQRAVFYVYGASLYFALGEAHRLGLQMNLSALTQGLAIYAQNIQDYTSASHLFRTLADQRKAVQDFDGEASAYHHLGMIAEERRDFTLAETWYSKSLTISEEKGYEENCATTYYQLGRTSEVRLDHISAEKFYRKALEIWEKKNHERGMAMCYHVLGNISLARHALLPAEQWYGKSLVLSNRLGDNNLAAITYRQLGAVALERRDFASAITWFHKSLAIDEKAGNEEGRAVTYHELGRAAQEQRDFSTAEAWYHKALAIAEKREDSQQVGATYTALGNCAMAQGDLESAKRWFEKVIEVVKGRDDEPVVAMAFHQLGVVAQEQGDLALAETWYHKGRVVWEKQSNNPGLSRSYFQLGKVAQHKHDFEAAESWYLRALGWWEADGDKQLSAGACVQLGNLAGWQERWLEAGRWFVRAIPAFLDISHEEGIQGSSNNFFVFFRLAPPEEQTKLKAMWEEAGLGQFPDEM